jgi:hypothetical protein
MSKNLIAVEMANSNLKWQKRDEKRVLEGNNAIWKPMKKDCFWEYRQQSQKLGPFNDES